MGDHSIIHNIPKKKIYFFGPLVSTYPAKSLQTLPIPPTDIEKYYFS